MFEFPFQLVDDPSSPIKHAEHSVIYNDKDLTIDIILEYMKKIK